MTTPCTPCTLDRMPPTRFPAELQSELAQTMSAYAWSAGADDARFVKIRLLIARHAHATSMTPESMVIAVRDVYGSVSQNDAQTRELLRNVYDDLMSGWIRAYRDVVADDGLPVRLLAI